MQIVKKMVGCAVALALGAGSVFAQTAPDPVSTVTGATSNAQTAWAGFAAVSASAFVFGMIIAYARKGKR